MVVQVASFYKNSHDKIYRNKHHHVSQNYFVQNVIDISIYIYNSIKLWGVLHIDWKLEMIMVDS